MPKQADRLTEATLKAMETGEWRADGAVPGLIARSHRGGVSFTYRYAWGGQRKTFVIGDWVGALNLKWKWPKKEAKAKYDAATMAAKIAEGQDPATLIDVVLKQGATPLLTLDQARTVATALRAKLKGGEDPAADRKADWRTLTLEQALDAYFDGGKERAERTQSDYRALASRYLPDWLKRPLASISPQEAHERHKRIGKERGRFVANHTMRVLSAVWRRMRKIHPSLPSSPTEAVEAFPEPRREGAIPREALPAWWRETLALANDVRRDLYTLMLFTGLRRESACSIRVADVDLDKGTLHIPKPKGGEARAFTLPLSAFLVSVVKQRIAGNAARLAGTNEWRRRKKLMPEAPSEWLFPAHSESGHVEEPRADADDGYSMKWIPHGLRNTYATAAATAGVHHYALKLLLNHALPKEDVTAGYLQIDVEALRPEQEKITRALLALLEAPAKALPPPPLALPAPSVA